MSLPTPINRGGFHDSREEKIRFKVNKKLASLSPILFPPRSSLSSPYLHPPTLSPSACPPPSPPRAAS